MASTYVLAATIRARLGSRSTPLLDWDEDGDEDDDLLDELITDAGAIINARLAQKLSVPFANISDATPTPEAIETIAKHLVLWQIYQHSAPEGADANTHFGIADSMLTMIAKGEADIDGAARQTGAKAGHVAVYTAETPAFAGRTSDEDLSRTRGI